MAENPDAIELQRRARRRLVGAIALVVFVVIVLPIIFDREPKPISQDLTIQIPSQDAGRFPSRVQPAAEPRPETRAAAADSRPEAAKTEPEARPDAGTANASPAAGAEKADRVAAPAKAPAAPTVPAKAPDTVGAANDTAKATADAAKPPAGAGFVVPLGLFRNPDNVRKVRGWVTSAGFASFTEEAPETAVGGKAAAVKVLAGPFPTRDAADKARDRLKARGVDVGPVAAR